MPESMNSTQSYMRTLGLVLSKAVATDTSGLEVSLDDAIKKMGGAMRAAHNRGNRLFFIGNGGSAGICSHLATDYSKNGGVRALAFNDGAVLTCLGNDFGYEYIFAKQIEWHAQRGDILVAISSSGQSINILNAVRSARSLGCDVYTLSGFKSDNSLRTLGDLNIYLANSRYGFVEIGHLAVMHAVLDIEMGWQPE